MGVRYPKFTVNPGEVEATVYGGGLWGDVWCVEIATDATYPRASVKEPHGIWLCHGKHAGGEGCRPTQVIWTAPSFSFVVHEEKDRVYVVGLPERPGAAAEEIVLASTSNGPFPNGFPKWEDRAKSILGILAGATREEHESIFREIHGVYCKDCGGERTLRSDGSRVVCHCTNDE